jgi:hypothetical protein
VEDLVLLCNLYTLLLLLLYYSIMLCDLRKRVLSTIKDYPSNEQGFHGWGTVLKLDTPYFDHHEFTEAFCFIVQSLLN